MITLIGYGLGNIKAFKTVYTRLNIPVTVATKPEELLQATKLILPGVGSFDYAMALLDRSGLREALDEVVVQKKVPILGVCVGMQMMGESSEEGKLPGLGWIKGSVKKFDETRLEQKTHLPHMGWNDVYPVGANPLFKGLQQGSRFYFLHSYYIQPSEAGDNIAESEYGSRFCCAVNSGNVYGAQFHPEKSHHYGLNLLKNFSEL